MNRATIIPLLAALAVTVSMSVSADILINGVSAEECNCRYGYYMPVGPEPFENHNLTARITFTDPAWTNISIDHDTIAADTVYDFGDPGANRQYWIMADSAGTTIGRSLRFTALPVLHLYLDTIPLHSGGDYVPAWLSLTRPDTTTGRMDIKIKYRGGSTNTYTRSKRNFKVKFTDRPASDSLAKKMDRKLLDLRNDNSWVLDAMQIDLARMRNYVATSIWEDMCVRPYYASEEPKARLYPRGRLVEVLFGDDLRGIYCLYEPVDRKQMKLKKYDEATLDIHGQLWKSKDWSYSVFMGHNSDNNYYPGTSPAGYYNGSESWDYYNVKYPDIDDVDPTDWSTLYNAVDFVCTASDDEFRAHAGEYFDLPVVIDYYILMETILSTDNHGKNMFFAAYDKQVDKKITLGVWDMDATCGQRWSDSYYHQSFLGPEQDYAQFITQYEHGDYNLFRRLRNTDAENFNLRVAKRYRELRQNSLATESILQRFRTYFDHFRTAGADQREYNKWSYDSDVAYYELNFDTEYAYIADWFTRRMQYLDETRFDLQNLPPNGDANGDGVVTIADVTAIVNHILGKPQSGTFNEVMADTNGDGSITIADVTATVNLILGKE